MKPKTTNHREAPRTASREAPRSAPREAPRSAPREAPRTASREPARALREAPHGASHEAARKRDKSAVKTASKASKTARAGAAALGSDLAADPAIKKLLEYAKGKKSVSYDEVNDFLPDAIVNSDRIEEVIALLEKHNIKLEDEEISLEIEEEKPGKDRKKLIYSDKESSVDDPIRLYLREIGKENLLTAEQEVELSKAMEDGGEHHQGSHQELRRARAGVPAPGPARHLDAGPPGDEPLQEGSHRVPGGDAQARRLLQGALQGPPGRRQALHGDEAPDRVRGRGHLRRILRGEAQGRGGLAEEGRAAARGHLRHRGAAHRRRPPDPLHRRRRSGGSRSACISPRHGT